jgi:hypothetical protein
MRRQRKLAAMAQYAAVAPDAVGSESSIVIGIIHPRQGGHTGMYEPHVCRVRISNET